MAAIRSLFSKVVQPSAKMAKTKTPPPPTVPTAIKSTEEATLGEGGESVEEIASVAGSQIPNHAGDADDIPIHPLLVTWVLLRGLGN